MASTVAARNWEVETMDSNVNSLWFLANVLGAVVVVAVAALLTILVLLVRVIDKRVAQIRKTLTQAKANTAHATLIDTTAAGVDAVLAEGLEHHLFLGRVLDKVRS
jgi:uncharacterized membrane protein